MPVGYRQFDVDRDERVIFLTSVRAPGRSYVLRGALHRPDRTAHDTFQCEVRLAFPGQSNEYRTHQAIKVQDRKAFPGEWTLDLFIDDEQIGGFTFFLGDATAIARTKRRGF